MKQVVSISLGSSERDHQVETEILGEKFMIRRQGTNGDMQKAIQLFSELDGKVDAFGLGGIDLYIHSGNKRYTFRDAKKLVREIEKTPVVDGSGLKDTLERRTVYYMMDKYGAELRDKKVLMVCGVDRFGMAQALVNSGLEVYFGDIIFALGIPILLKSLKSLHRIARTLCPIITQLPFKLVYPTGESQKMSKQKFQRYYQKADILAGDYHYIKRYLPNDLTGKLILTNTVTPQDVAELRKRGAWLLVTTTPSLNGRSFGTNVMEGVLVSIAQKNPEELTPEDYNLLLDQIGFRPRIEVLNESY